MDVQGVMRITGSILMIQTIHNEDSHVRILIFPRIAMIVLHIPRAAAQNDMISGYLRSYLHVNYLQYL